jgi:hypothetical protein
LRKLLPVASLCRSPQRLSVNCSRRCI